MPGSIHIEFDEQGKAAIKRLEGELPKGTQEHVQELLGWLDKKTQEDPQGGAPQPGDIPPGHSQIPPQEHVPGQSSPPIDRPPVPTHPDPSQPTQPGHDQIGEPELPPMAAKTQEKPDHSQAPDPQKMQQEEHMKRTEGDGDADVEQTSVPYLNQDAGRAGKAPVPQSPPRVIPSGMVGHPGVQQTESSSPMALYYRNDQTQGGQAHVQAEPDSPIMEELLAQQQQEQGISDEDMERLNFLKEAITEAARTRDHSRLHELREQFLELKADLMEKMDYTNLLQQMPVQDPLPPGMVDSPQPGSGVPQQPGQPMAQPPGQVPGQPPPQPGQEPTPKPGQAGFPPEAPQPGKAPTPGQAPPESPPPAGQPPKEAPPNIGEGHEAVPKPPQDAPPVAHSPVPNPNLHPETPPPQMAPRHSNVPHPPIGRPPLQDALKKEPEEEEDTEKSLEFAKTIGEWMVFWKDPLAKGKVMAHNAKHKTAHIGPPKPGHKYIRRWLEDGHWHYAYAEGKGKHHGTGKAAVHGMMHSAIAGGGDDHSMTIEIHPHLSHEGKDAQKVKHAHHAWQQTVKKMGHGTGGADKEHHKLRWQEQGADGKWYAIQQNADKTREVLMRPVGDSKLSDEALHNLEFDKKKDATRLSQYMDHFEQSVGVAEHKDLPSHAPFTPEWSTDNDLSTEKRPSMSFRGPDGEPWLVLVDRGPEYVAQRFQIKESNPRGEGIAADKDTSYLPFTTPEEARKMVRFLLAFEEVKESGGARAVFKGTVPEGFSDFDPAEDDVAHSFETGNMHYEAHVDKNEKDGTTTYILRPKLTDNQIKKMIGDPRLKNILSSAAWRASKGKQVSSKELQESAKGALLMALTIKRTVGRKGKSLSGFIPGRHLYGYIANALAHKAHGGGVLQTEAAKGQEKGGMTWEAGKEQAGQTQATAQAEPSAPKDTKEKAWGKAKFSSDLKFAHDIKEQHMPHANDLLETIDELTEDLPAGAEQDRARAFLETVVDVWFRGDPKGHSTESALDQRMKELYPNASRDEREELYDAHIGLFSSEPLVQDIYTNVVMKLERSLLSWEKTLEKSVMAAEARVTSGEMTQAQLDQVPDYQDALRLLFGRKCRRLMNHAIQKSMNGTREDLLPLKEMVLEGIADTLCWPQDENVPTIPQVVDRAQGALFMHKSYTREKPFPRDAVVNLVKGWYQEMKADPIFKSACYLLLYAQNGRSPELKRMASESLTQAFLRE